MKRWIVTVHSTGGSMGEAVDSMFTVRVADRTEAVHLCSVLNEVAAERKYEHIWATCAPIEHDLVSMTDERADMKEAFSKVLAKRFD